MKQLRLGIIGTNTITEKIIEGARAVPEISFTAVYSRTKEKADAFGDKYGIAFRYTELSEFCASSAMDAVYIASPNALHAAQAMLALEHGKDVLCEKPIASNAKELQAMLALAKEKERIVMEAMRPVYDPGISILQANLARLGQLRKVSLEFCQYSSRYDAFLQGDIQNAFRSELSNAAVMDIGVYPLAVAAMLFGMPHAILASSVLLTGGMEGSGEVILSYPELQVRIGYAKICQSIAPSYFLGEKGAITLDKVNNPNTIRFLPRMGREETLYKSEKSNIRYEMEAFLSAFRTRNAAQGNTVSVITMEMLDEIRRQGGIVFPAD